MKQNNNKVKVWAIFTDEDHDDAVAYAYTEEVAGMIAGSIPESFVIPFRISPKQWTALFATGRIVWANIVEDKKKERV